VATIDVDSGEAWLWTVTIGGERVASGYEADGPEGARPGVRAAEKAWAECRK
jgi:hypothetical protein